MYLCLSEKMVESTTAGVSSHDFHATFKTFLEVVHLNILS